MGDAERVARQAVEEVAGNRFARRKSDRMDEAVELRPGFAQLPECALDLRVVGDVEVEDELGAELGGVLGHALLEALSLVAERQLGAFAVAGPGDAVGDGAVVQDAGDQKALAGQESHAVSKRLRCRRIFAPRGVHRGT